LGLTENVEKENVEKENVERGKYREKEKKENVETENLEEENVEIKNIEKENIEREIQKRKTSNILRDISRKIILFCSDGHSFDHYILFSSKETQFFNIKYRYCRYGGRFRF
jgi:hypothetical protein